MRPHAHGFYFAMDNSRKAVRYYISNMAPKRALEFVQSFDLPEDEESCIILCDIRRKSYIQVSNALHVSPESVKRNRRRAFSKIVDALTNQ
nr:MAG: Protein of unknown function (DUF2802) [Bacteriophage sp.]